VQTRCPHKQHPLSTGVSGHSQQLCQDGAWGNGIAVKGLQFRNMPAIDTQVFSRAVSCMETETTKYGKAGWISELE